jgi:glycosyltransferase involved in cell wall biosynthesis
MGSHYDVRYTRSIYAAFWSALYGREIAFEIHEPFDTQGWWLKTIFKYLSRSKNIVKWVFISEALKDATLSSYPSIAEHRCFVANDGADAIQDKPGVDTQVANIGRRRVGYIGSLLKGKAMEIVIPLSKICIDAEFHIVGGKESDIQKLKAQLNKDQDNVIFYGFIPPGETPRYIEQFDILIAPYSRGVFVENENDSNNIAQWMSPLKIFEYMSSAKPIIASDLPVLKEVLIHGENSFLCDPDKLESWKDAISELSSDPVLAARIGKSAQSDFLQRHTWQERAGKILKGIVSSA